jgi:dihydrodipicolinate synthase/N-acetylneuraminate lyase
MKELLGIRGIITVLNTPFTDNDEIDVESLKYNVDEAMHAGVAGFLVPAMASEVTKLSDEERDLEIATVLDEVKGRIPVIGGASAATAEARIKHARAAIDAGCDGILASIPYDQDIPYAADVEELARLDPGFLMLQDWSASDYGIPVPLIARLFEEIDAFRALKIEVVPAGTKYTEVLEATSGRLHVSGGWAVMQLIEALDRGIHAFMPTGLHHVYTRIYNLYINGDRDAARALFNKIVPVLAFSNQHLDISIHFFKRLMFKQGIFSTPGIRFPILPFDGVHEKIADEMIELAIALEQEANTRE